MKKLDSIVRQEIHADIRMARKSIEHALELLLSWRDQTTMVKDIPEDERDIWEKLLRAQNTLAEIAGQTVDGRGREHG